MMVKFVKKLPERLMGQCHTNHLYLLFFIAVTLPTESMARENEPPIRSPKEVDGATKVNAEELINLANKIPTLILIDSRLTTNRSFGYIESSVTLSDVETNCESLEKIIPTTTSPVLFYCNGPKCGRSVIAVKIAKGCGFKDLYWFRGGIEEWKAKNYPLVK